MKPLKYLFGIAITGLIIASCGSENKTNGSGDQNNADSTDKEYPVRTQKIEKELIPRTLDYTASLEAYKVIHLAPASPGRINTIYVDINDRVYKGQPLVEMDKTQLSQAQVQYQNAKINYERIDTLNQLGSIARQQYDMAKTQYEVSKSNYEFLKENTSMLSPINGIITGKYFENGELYSGAPNTQAGKAAVLTIMQINPMKAIVGIAETYYPLLHEGINVDVSTDIFPDKKITGRISKIYPVIDPNSRNFNIEITIENSNEKLKPGMYANTIIKLGDVKALVVPSIAVLKQEGTNNRYVFINDSGTAKQVNVKIGERFDDKVEILSDQIKEGDELILEGQANLMNGSKVKPVK